MSGISVKFSPSGGLREELWPKFADFVCFAFEGRRMAFFFKPFFGMLRGTAAVGAVNGSLKTESIH